MKIEKTHNLVHLEANLNQVLPIFCQIGCLNRADFILSIHVLHTNIYCMLTSRNIVWKNAREKSYK